MGKNKGPTQKSLLPLKCATKTRHKNVTLELLGWFPIFLQGAAVFAEFGEYITHIHRLSSYLFNNKSAKIGFSLCKNVKPK